ncbi:hypothetical protein INS49_000733 [Diaporthe citri]|uniref:uncharacterized protein n=1 Tax=Diaporthe citri TaxID=83186 RepID=UPI001C7FF115|nr:uncharacterized protein INS49_000733 [Diaporthe citri]KAG6366555.1 hypothetical protein INS49_000733 [Diaporthe citri]
MPTEDLRKSLAKPKVEELQRLDNDRPTTNQNFKNWNKALEACANGWRMPRPRYQVVVSPNSLISTPEKLQDIAGMTAPPKIINTTYTTLNGDRDDAHLQAYGKPEEVQVGEVSWPELVEIRNKTECDHWLFVWVDGKVSGATLVKSFKTRDKNDQW